MFGEFSNSAYFSMSSAGSQYLTVEDLFFEGESRGNGSSIGACSISGRQDSHEMSVEVNELFVELIKVVFIRSIKFIGEYSQNFLE